MPLVSRLGEVAQVKIVVGIHRGEKQYIIWQELFRRHVDEKLLSSTSNSKHSLCVNKYLKVKKKIF